MTSTLWINLPLFLFFTGVIAFVSNRKHLLSMLLSLEFMVIGLFFLLFCFISGFSSEYYVLLLFITFSVCEGALGISVLVSMTRSHGNDYFKSFSVT